MTENTTIVSKIPAKSMLSKLPTPSVRVRKPLYSRENDDLNNGSYLDSLPGVSTDKKRSSLDSFEEGPLDKRVRSDAPTPTKEPVKNPALARILKKRARRSLNRAKAISYNKAAKASQPLANKTSLVPPRGLITPSTKRPIATAKSVPRASAKPFPAKRIQADRDRPAARKAAPLATVEPTASKNVATKRKPWDLKGQIEDLKGALAKQKARELQTEDILRRLTALESERQAISQENTHLSGNIEGKNQEIDGLKREIRKLEEEARNREADLELARRDIRSMRKERDELDLELRAARKKNQELQDLREQHEKQISEQENQIEELTAVKSAHINQITKQEEDLRLFEQERKKLLNDVQELKGNIRVFCRVRPALGGEEEPDHINYEGKAGKSINITNDRNKECKHNFDKVFGPAATQMQVYEELSQLVQSSLDGYNVCVFAYGQTGSGKTYTMEGPDNCTAEQVGIIPRAMEQIFKRTQEMKKFGMQFTLSVQHVEIYCEKLNDLLREKDDNPEKLEIRTTTKSGESTVWVSGLSSHPVTKYSDVTRLLNLSKKRRATAATLANDRSSRSHSVFMLTIKAINEDSHQETESTLNLIDLAGSERVSETGSSGNRLKEAKKINGSLSSLSAVISALSKKEQHVPYRNSRLTFLLMNSLGGNSKTLMVVNINPTKLAVSETINTLRFATTVNECNIGTAQKVVKF